MSDYDATTGLEYLIKQPAESRLYDIPFTGLLRDGDTISGVDDITQTNQGIVTGSGDLTLGSPITNTTKAQVRISGGTNGESYKLECVCSTAGGDTLEMDVMIRVKG
jgi:hypothetical protein